MHIHPFQALLPAVDKIPNPADFFARCKADYLHFLEQGYFYPEQPAVYYYEINTPQQVSRGILAGVDIRDYIHGRIKKHEHTIGAKEALQRTLFKAQQAFVKPVLATYTPSPNIQAWMDTIKRTTPPILEIQESEACIHRLTLVSNPEALKTLFHFFETEVAEVLIADGHHRCAAAATMYQEHPEKPFDHLFCALFDSDALTIHNFNRLVDLQEYDSDRFLEDLQRYCTLTPCSTPIIPQQTHELLLILEQEWYLLLWKPEYIQQYRDIPLVLDVQLLNDLVFKNILGIDEVRKEPRISYLEGPAGLDELREKSIEKGRAGFCLHPISIPELMHLASQEIMVPPKSTWFEPRMKSGLIICPWK